MKDMESMSLRSGLHSHLDGLTHSVNRRALELCLVGRLGLGGAGREQWAKAWKWNSSWLGLLEPSAERDDKEGMFLS